MDNYRGAGKMLEKGGQSFLWEIYFIDLIYTFI